MIWTALGPKFKEQEDVAPNEDDAIEYLKDLLSAANAANAMDYVRCTPPQINTAYRQRIVDCFGPEWAFPAAENTADGL